jgi:hypothetical protein
MIDADRRERLKAQIAEIEARKPLNRAEVVAVLCDQAGGIECACGCGELLDPLSEGVTDEHVRALGLLGTNELENRRFYRRPCAKRKTDVEDIPRIAHAKRQSKLIEPPEPSAHPIPQRDNPWPPKGSRKLGKRPFKSSRPRQEERP